MGHASWRDAMDNLAQATGSHAANLMPVIGRLPGVPHSSNLDRTLEEYFGNSWQNRDGRMKALPLLRQSRVVLDVNYLDERDYQQEYFQFLNAHNLRHGCIVGFSVGGDVHCCMLHRAPDQYAYTQEESSVFIGLSHRLTLASTIAATIADAKAMGLGDGFDSLGVGAFLFDRRGRVVRLNAAAERLLGDDLQLRRGEIWCRSPADMRALHRQLAAVLNGQPIEASQAVAVTRDGRRPLVFRFQTTPGFMRDFFSIAKAVAIVDDLDACTRTPETVVQSALGLTPAEASIAVLLSNGEGVPEIAELKNITVETVRTHVKTILRKLDLHRQSEVTALIARLR